jgi:stalled ribosome rescue protein Dom34
MTQHFHTVIWIDSREAHIIGFNWDEAEGQVVRHKDAPHKVHHKAGTMGSGHAAQDPHFFNAVADAATHAGEVLIAGPGLTSTQLMKHLEAEHPALAKKVVGVMVLDHPTDGELVKFARTYFRRADHMTAQRPH